MVRASRDNRRVWVSVCGSGRVMQVFKCTYVRMRRQSKFFEWLTRRLDQRGTYRVS